ncbi:MAG: SAM-dependent methyltransferase [Myxococcota bacterium]
MTRATGDWGWLARSGSERDLIEELGPTAERKAEGVVRSRERPRRHDGGLDDPIFARQAMRKPHPIVLGPEGPGPIVEALVKRLTAALSAPWSLQVVSPDSRDPQDPRRHIAADIEGWFAAAEAAPFDGDEAAELVQVWVAQEDLAWVGVTPVRWAVSPWPGGKQRLRRQPTSVSRAGLKLEEAIAWAGVGPQKGDLVADLGAAPGGWTQVLLQTGATVIAVDPKSMKVSAAPKRFAHLRQSAFTYAPPETLDWVVCDMAYRPLEVAKLLAKWARRSWARQVISNIKLPMKMKVSTLKQVRDTLSEAGWEGIKIRQLFHDRDEVTLYAHLSAGLAARPAQAPFRLRASRTQPRSRTPPRQAPRRRKRNTSIKRRQ